MATPNIETIIRDRVTLTIDCIDRLYLNGYVPRLQTSGQLYWFLREHLGNPVPSPNVVYRASSSAQVTGQLSPSLARRTMVSAGAQSMPAMMPLHGPEPAQLSTRTEVSDTLLATP